MTDIFVDCGVPIIFLLLAISRLGLISDLPLRIIAVCVAALYLFSFIRPIHFYLPLELALIVRIALTFLTMAGCAVIVFGRSKGRDQGRRA